MLLIVATVISAWLLADLITGVVHWAQDKLLTGVTRFRILNQIKEDNDLHHSRPAALLRYSYWGNISTSAPLAWVVAMILFFIDAPYVLVLAFIFGGFANLIHRFSHEPRKGLHPIIRFLQWTGLFISIDHHRAHHFDEKGVIRKEDTTGSYCPMTNWLNPILDRIGFFRFLEWIFRR